VRKRDVGRRLVILDRARLLNGATGIALAGDGHRGPAVEGDGVDEGQQKAAVLLFVGATQRRADLQRDDLGVRRRLDADLLLLAHRHVPADLELRRGERRRIEGGSGSVADQGGVEVERNLRDLALGICGEQQRGDQQGSSKPQDPARRDTQRHCAVQTVPPVLDVAGLGCPNG
jgi:hypothetical protein